MVECVVLIVLGTVAMEMWAQVKQKPSNLAGFQGYVLALKKTTGITMFHFMDI
jgi:hypothetical protein